MALAEALFMTGGYRDARTRDPRLARPQPRRGPQLSRAGRRSLPRQCPRRPPSRLGPGRRRSRPTTSCARSRPACPDEDHRHFTRAARDRPVADGLRPISHRPARRSPSSPSAPAPPAAPTSWRSAELRSMWPEYLEFPNGSAVRDLTALTQLTGSGEPDPGDRRAACCSSASTASGAIRRAPMP